MEKSSTAKIEIYGSLPKINEELLEVVQKLLLELKR